MQIIDTGALGTRSAVLRLKRRDSRLNFLVFPMLHVASPVFYAEVRRRLGECAVVVAEGVSGPTIIGSALMLTYRVIPQNRASGLVEQDIDYRALGVEVINPDVTGAEFDRTWRSLSLKCRLLMWVMLPVIVVLQLLGGRKRLLAPDVAINDDDELPDSDIDEEFERLFGGERDDRLLAALVELHRTRSDERIDVAVVYGAAHVPRLVHRLADTLDYRPRTAHWITAIDW
ncbi:MAG: hypothetical protein GEV28_10145 [Actinophytocola sp.]|uniref:hypothetical protein n=1 Tax=Actinophytocola sp. TaxID=1872138 RepID=UPI0013232052|nr:hypothetical protein [Actinophytocola sp.]MPZ80725.1 hypothetical protein [Actinophytocola sp.]